MAFRALCRGFLAFLVDFFVTGLAIFMKGVFKIEEFFHAEFFLFFLGLIPVGRMAFDTLGYSVPFFPNILAILIGMMTFIALNAVILKVFLMSERNRWLYGFGKTGFIVDFKLRLHLLVGKNHGRYAQTYRRDHDSAQNHPYSSHTFSYLLFMVAPALDCQKPMKA